MLHAHFLIWLFPYIAIGRFCEAIIDFLADEQRATSSGITASQFEGEVFSAYDTLFNVWLLSKDARVSDCDHSNHLMIL